MAPINSDFIEKYQRLYEKDPTSQVFAPLAEAYRKLGLLKEAKEVCEKGVAIHPNFASGHVAFARVLIDLKDFPRALDHLQQSVHLAPENILAHTLLGETLLQVKRPKEALRSYKMVLFLNPTNDKAQTAVRRLESLTADDYEEDLFKMTPAQETLPEEKEEVLSPEPFVSEQKGGLSEAERYISLIDAYLVRNDLEMAWEIVQKAQVEVPNHPDLEKRVKMLRNRKYEWASQVTQTQMAANDEESKAHSPPEEDPEEDETHHKASYLKELLGRIERNKHRT